MRNLNRPCLYFVRGIALFAVLLFAIPSAGNADVSRQGHAKGVAALKASSSTASSVRSADVSSAQVDGICSSVVDHLWERTDYYFHQGDYPRVISLDLVISQIDPNFLEPYATGGWLMESDGDLKDAEAYYRLGAVNNPDKSYAWYQLGMFYFNTLHAYDKSVAVFVQSTKLADAGANDWKMLAHSYEKEKDYKDALAAWIVIKQKFPTAPAIDSNMSRVKALVDAENKTSTSSPS